MNKQTIHCNSIPNCHEQLPQGRLAPAQAEPCLRKTHSRTQKSNSNKIPFPFGDQGILAGTFPHLPAERVASNTWESSMVPAGPCWPGYGKSPDQEQAQLTTTRSEFLFFFAWRSSESKLDTVRVRELLSGRADRKHSFPRRPLRSIALHAIMVAHAHYDHSMFESPAVKSNAAPGRNVKQDQILLCFP